MSFGDGFAPAARWRGLASEMEWIDGRMGGRRGFERGSPGYIQKR
jgi:hypothetical protein